MADSRTSEFIERIPVGPLALMPLESIRPLGEKVNAYLSQWRSERESEHKKTIAFNGYQKDSYIVETKVSRFGTGEAKATVIMLDEAYSEDEDGHKSKVYAPVVEYTVGDETYTEMSPVHRSPCKFTVGQTVMVHYDPADPHVMIIEGDDGTKFLYILFMGMGGFFALIGLVFDISGVRSKREVL